MGLQDLTGSANKIAHAYEVLRPGCRISRVWNNRSNMTTRYQDEAARSHGFERPDSACLERIRTGLQGLQDLRGKKHQIGTCLRGIRVGLHDLSGKEQQFQHAYKVSGWVCRISRARQTRSYMPTRYQDEAHGFGTPYSTCLERIRMGLQDLMGKEHQIVHTYEVSGLGCIISRVRNNSANMHIRYQDGAAGSHG